MRHERRAAHPPVALALKKLQKFLADFVPGHFIDAVTRYLLFRALRGTSASKPNKFSW